MSKYVKLEDVEAMLDNASIISDPSGEFCGYCTDDIKLDTLPVADVAPVMHAKWVKHPHHLGFYMCSNCSNESFDLDNFCSKCGYKMDL